MIKKLFLVGSVLSSFVFWMGMHTSGYSKGSIPVNLLETDNNVCDVCLSEGSKRFKQKPARPLEMLFVEGGTFKMGCTNEQTGCLDNEMPVIKATLKDFLISSTEITVAQFEKFVLETGYKTAGEWKGELCMEDYSNCDYPVVNVNWQDAMAFCKWAGGRLPYEAEWEYAARGGFYDNNDMSVGAGGKLENVGWFADNSKEELHVVALKTPNELGLYDMSGNVWEWCMDWYDSKHYETSNGTQPTGAATGKTRVLRGGAYDSYRSNCRVSYRENLLPTYFSNRLGFRLVKEIK